MENPEEILHSLEEFSKLKPKDIPRELEDYLCFVAKTGDPVYQWGTIKSLFKEKLINVITEFYESCPSVEIPPCPNVEVFNYESMKSFILEKLDTFAAAPFTVQRICELLTTPRKEYNRIDKYMRALEKNILVVSTTEPGFRRTAENGEGIVNGLESEHVPDTNNSNNDINVEEMDDAPVWSRITPETVSYQNAETNVNIDLHPAQPSDTPHPTFSADTRTTESSCGSSIDSVITCRPSEEQPYVSIEPVASDSCLREENIQESDVTVTITAIPAAVQKRRDSIEPIVSSGEENATQESSEFVNTNIKENPEASSSSNNIEILCQESAPGEAEASTVEDSNATISTSPTTKDLPEACEDSTANQITKSPQSEAPLIQIPIISEITAGVSEHEIENIKETEALNLNTQEKTVTEDSPTLKEQIDTISETASQISTTVTSTAETIESQTVICENSAIIVSKETLVSSTEEISNDASDVLLRSSQLAQTNDELQNYGEELSQDGLLTPCAGDTNISAEPKEAHEKQSEEVSLKEIQEFPSSSNTQHSMDIDITEESCQEAPTSDG